MGSSILGFEDHYDTLAPTDSQLGRKFERCGRVERHEFPLVFEYETGQSGSHSPEVLN